jgi:hypothetical protein
MLPVARDSACILPEVRQYDRCIAGKRRKTSPSIVDEKVKRGACQPAHFEVRTFVVVRPTAPQGAADRRKAERGLLETFDTSVWIINNQKNVAPKKLWLLDVVS